MIDIPPNLLTELEWRFRNGRDYDTRRIAGQAKATIEQQRQEIESLRPFYTTVIAHIDRMQDIAPPEDSADRILNDFVNAIEPHLPEPPA